MHSTSTEEQSENTPTQSLLATTTETDDQFDQQRSAVGA